MQKTFSAFTSGLTKHGAVWINDLSYIFFLLYSIRISQVIIFKRTTNPFFLFNHGYNSNVTQRGKKFFPFHLLIYSFLWRASNILYILQEHFWMCLSEGNTLTSYPLVSGPLFGFPLWQASISPLFYQQHYSALIYTQMQNSSQKCAQWYRWQNPKSSAST